MTKLFKKTKEKKETRVKRNINIDKDFYNTPMIIKDDISPKKRNIIKNIFNSKYTNMAFIVVAAILIGFLMFYFINYNSFNETIECEHHDIDKNYVFLGDSLTKRYDFDKYFPDIKNRIVNSGINGNTTNDILDDMYNRVYRYNPSDVFILVGTNDITKKFELQKIFDNYVSIINQIEKNRPLAKIRVVSIYPVNYDMPKGYKSLNKIPSIKNLNAALKIYCRNNNIEYINMYPKLVDDKGYLKKEYTEDGLHINDKGYEVVTKVFRKYMEE